MANDLLAQALERALGAAAVLRGEDVSGRSAGVWGPPRTIDTDILVRPGSTEEVADVLRLCNEHRHPVVVHGGLTNVVDSTWAEPGDLVLSLERLRRIEEVDTLNRTMTLEAAVPMQSAQEEARRHGLMFALDLGARGTATVGGNAATNAGGTQVIRYGMAREQILGLEVVLADGTVLSSMNRMLKNNAGYDLKQLFIGSEGTLGVVTRLVLRMRALPRSQDTALVACANFDRVARLLAHLEAALGGTLSAFEVMWRDYYRFVTTPPAESRPPLDQTHPFVVLIESLGADVESDAARFETVLADALEQELLTDAVIAKSQAEREALWMIRDDVVQLLRLQPMFLFDVSLPIGAMPAYVEALDRGLHAEWPDGQLFVFGHLGDGNLHVAICAGAEDGSARHAVERLVYGPLRQIRGSISAEHGIGLEKKSYLSISRTPEEIALMRTLKRCLDPNNILNPGKVFDLA